MSKNRNNNVSESPEMDFFMNESMSDVVFIIDGQRLPASKTFLSFKNRVFRTLFFDKLKDSNVEEIVVEDTTFEAFKTVIQFLYSEKLFLKKVNDIELILEVCKLSDNYEIPKLLQIIGNHLKTIDVTIENLYLISRIAYDYKIKDLMSYVETGIDNSFKGLVNKKDINALIKEVFEISEKYDIPKLFDITINHLKTNPFENLNLITRIAFDYKNKDLMSYVMIIINNYFNELINSKGFKNLIDLNDMTSNEVMRVMVKKYIKLYNESNKERKRLKDELNKVKGQSGNKNMFVEKQCKHCSCYNYYHSIIPAKKHCRNCGQTF